MADLPQIAALPPAPVPTDTPNDFALKAAAFVPKMSEFGDDVNAFGAALESYAILQIENLTATLSATNHGLYDAVVIGDTDGVNREFEVLGIGFYPAWNFFVDGIKIAKDEMSISGSTVTLSTAPISGASVEATGSRDYSSIAPEGYKTIWMTSILNGTLEMSCTSSNSASCHWVIQGQDTVEAESFSYVNDGSSVTIYCYVPDNMVGGIFRAESCGIINFNVDFNLTSVGYIDLADNSIVSASAVVGLSSLNGLNGSFLDNSLTGFPLVDTSEVVSFSNTWRNNALLGFPALNSSNVRTFLSAWFNNSLTSFPAIDSSNVTVFDNAWRNNSLTTFPPMDYSSGESFQGAWSFNDLTVSSVNSILIRLNNAGISNAEIGLDGGTNGTPIGEGLTAKAALESRGCTVSVN